MTIGSIFDTLAYVVWLFASGFGGFLFGYILRGTGNFLQSGTKEAFIYDHLKALAKDEDYEKITGRLWIVTSTAFLIAGLTAGFLADRFSFTFVLGITVVTNILATIFTVIIPDAPKSKSTEETSYIQFIRNEWTSATKHPLLLTAIFYTMTILAVDGILDEYDQLYVTSIGLPLASLGIWWGMRMLAETIAGFTVDKFKKYNRSLVLDKIALISFGLLTIAGLVDSIYMMGVVALCFYFFAIAVILNEARIQHLVESHERATVNSINALMKKSSVILIGLLYGLVANQFNPRIAVLVFAGMILVYLTGKTFLNRNQPTVARSEL
jgi:MFS family permease